MYLQEQYVIYTSAAYLQVFQVYSWRAVYEVLECQGHILPMHTLLELFQSNVNKRYIKTTVKQQNSYMSTSVKQSMLNKNGNL